MSVNPFDSVMRSRAAFDAGHHNTDVVNGLSQARFDTYTDGGQPPISYGGRDQGLAYKVAAPPLTLDFTTKTDSQVNLAGILKARHRQPEMLDLGASADAPAGQENAPETVALVSPDAKTVEARTVESAPVDARTTDAKSANVDHAEALNITILEAADTRSGAASTPEMKVADAGTTVVKEGDQGTLHVPALDIEAKNTLKPDSFVRTADSSSFIKRTPALSFAEFSSLQGDDAAKFNDANYDLSIKHTDQGSVFKHTYTAKDFSTCTLSSDGESINATVTDAYARKQFEESVTDGKSTVTRYSYDDSGSRRAMIPCVKEVTSPDGIKVFLYDKFGKVIQA
ncbi:MAG TPA: hypothetical protein V6C76_02490 [Drouetiella sp.]